MEKQDAAVAAPGPIVLTAGAVAHPSTIPGVPQDFKPMAGLAKNALLKVQSEQRAEVDQAMEQLWEKRVEIAGDLGKLAPNADIGKALHERMIAAREASRKAAALAVYSDEQEALANHELMTYLNRACKDVFHMAEREPQIAARYEKVLAASLQRGESIAAGIARSKANKSDPKKG
jgi:molybdopterin-biosynthesis enzyme MoeA-like protein